MNIEKVVTKYMEIIKSDTFAKYEKEFAQRICSALSKGYLRKLPEPPLVQIIENVVNGVHNLTMKDDKTYFELLTRSIFIHGNKSQVEFDYYGQNMQGEFGDLIFIISVVFNGWKYFEKLTINQFKKDRARLPPHNPSVLPSIMAASPLNLNRLSRTFLRDAPSSPLIPKS
ncbi:hypothetical protein HKBW3S44_01329 [Candidatus Hakubella thermalkaliphila]|uniref:Uncharacterized protein n=1 Tax=Candidatus Hakubella thermalkaliphila TaxID=2754717 RepID=A0A6V8PYQ2_9ACTN|nr:hypothetical protein [Candidatus Hakubella thermalkaliphila]GFP37652.1 hypothetical protein HKBW3S44_01329 [Candidatus Hakubella thermalkaliphila]